MAKEKHQETNKGSEEVKATAIKEAESLINQKVAEYGDKLSDEERQLVEKGLRDVLIEGKTPAEAMKLPESLPKMLYKQGYDLYNLGLYEEANHVFRLLCTFEPGAPRYHLALAATNHQMGKYEIAATMYFVSFFLDPTIPIPLYYISDCFSKLNEPDAALLLLEMTCNTCGDNPTYQKLKTRCYMMINQLREELGMPVLEEKIEGVPEGEKDIFSQFQEETESGNEGAA